MEIVECACCHGDALPSPQVRSLLRARARETTSKPRFIPGHCTAAMLLSDAVVRGNGWGKGKMGNGGNMKETKLVSLFNTKTLKPAVYPDLSVVNAFFVNSTR